MAARRDDMEKLVALRIWILHDCSGWLDETNPAGPSACHLANLARRGIVCGQRQ
jgi:hypothetical protein